MVSDDRSMSRSWKAVTSWTSLCGVAAVLSLAAGVSPATPAAADIVSRDEAMRLCSANDVGPITPYGELPEEAEAKRIVFAWNCMAMVEGKVEKAFETYVSKSFCDHSHLLTRGRKACGNYQETLNNFKNMAAMFSKGSEIEAPLAASVNGEMVTMYGAGVDIFRVKNGKITDHWDASPPKEVAIKAHRAETTAQMVKVIADAVTERSKKR